MWTKFVLAAAVTVCAAGFVAAQTAPPPPGENPSPSWRSAGDAAALPRPAGPSDSPPSSPAAPAVPAGAPTASTAGRAVPAAISTAGRAGPTATIARVSTGSGSLSNEQGQLYREYDISPYTLRVTSTRRPEQAIVDWILRETGYEAWHSETLAILSATPRKLRVYHTPAVQAVVADVVDRFVNSEAETQAFSLRVVTVDSPNWRTRVQRLLVSVQVQTPGVQAWLLEKEAAAMLVADLRRRSDYREQSSPYLMVSNGQSAVLSAMRGKNYTRNIRLRAEAWPGYEPETAVIDEGFSLEFSPLLSLDGRIIDAALKCEINQVEKLISVTLNAPTAAAPRQSMKMEVPQTCHFRFHERFRWPVEQVLLVSLGIVAVPVPSDPKSLIPGVPLPIGNSPPRAELLVFVEGKGKLSQSPQSPTAGDRAAGIPRGRQ
jgi:hypothetical protein